MTDFDPACVAAWKARLERDCGVEKARSFDFYATPSSDYRAGFEDVGGIMLQMLNDLLANPKGVVPASAEPFYNGRSGRFERVEG